MYDVPARDAVHFTASDPEPPLAFQKPDVGFGTEEATDGDRVLKELRC